MKENQDPMHDFRPEVAGAHLYQGMVEELGKAFEKLCPPLEWTIIVEARTS